MKFSRKVQNLIAAFRGLPKDCSTACFREELPIDVLVRWLVKKYTSTAGVATNSELFERWPFIIGNRFCKSAELHRITPDGTLIVKVSDSTVRQELFFLKQDILDRVHHVCPGVRIQKIVFSL